MADVVVKRASEYGWGLFRAGTWDKADGDWFGPWYPSRRLALAARALLSTPAGESERP